MPIYVDWLLLKDVPVCNVTSEPVDECDHVTSGEYDERDEWDLIDKQAREEADRG